jgi:hypothetical protein
MFTNLVMNRIDIYVNCLVKVDYEIYNRYWDCFSSNNA